ncbi:hypothetical protein FACS189483_05230 [Spirochaetia bacterium]|nr:hypothetical protein FACS189483_05230 [Spirochaetia bacterium]
MIITNNLNLPAGLVKAVSTERHNAPMCLSATTLLQGVKQILLTDRHWEQLHDDVADRIWAIWGTAVHSLLESEGENDFTEQEMAHQIGGITVTGRIDNYNMATGTICDYKTASINKVRFNDFSDWYLQGMIYAWLLTRNKFPVTHCRFIALLKDHSKTEAERDRQYPQNPVYVYEFPVTSAELFRIGAFIRSRIGEYEKYVSATDDEIPPCSASERWDRPSVFAVKKEGRQKAVKLFDDRGEAEARAAELGKGHYVEHRKGESVKCEHYCLCAGFCNFFQAHVIGIKSALPTVTTEENAEKLVA